MIKAVLAIRLHGFAIVLGFVPVVFLSDFGIIYMFCIMGASIVASSTLAFLASYRALRWTQVWILSLGSLFLVLGLLLFFLKERLAKQFMEL